MKRTLILMALLAAAGSAAAEKGPAFASLQSAASGNTAGAFENNTRPVMLAAFGNAPARRNSEGVLVITAPKWIDSPRDGVSGGPVKRMERNCGGLKGCLDKASYTETGSKTVAKSAFAGGLLGAIIGEAAGHSVAWALAGLFGGVALGVVIGAMIYGAYQANKDS